MEVYRSSYYFGAGTGPILYTYLNCDGTELRLDGCRTSSSFVFGASHFSDAGVRCQRPATTSKLDISSYLYSYSVILKFLQSDPAVLMVMFVW